MLDIKNRKDDHDLAVNMACKKFDEIYSKEMQPDWLKYCMAVKATRNQSKNWVIEMLLSPKSELEENEYWHWDDDGFPSLIKVNPITGEESYILCNGPATEKVVFLQLK